MRPEEKEQATVDKCILALTVVLAVAGAGMVTGEYVLIMLAIPLLLATLTIMSLCNQRTGKFDGPSLVAVCAFHLISLFGWIAAMLFINDHDSSFAGLPVSTGILVLFIWPLYALVSGLLYAYCSKRDGSLVDTIPIDAEAS